jgi:hypothetical protein
VRAAWPILLGTLCFAQLILVFYQITFFVPRPFDFSKLEIIFILRLIVWGLAVLFSIFTSTILINNFPDKIIVGRKKKNFNIFAFLGFLMIPFLFAFVIKVYKETPSLSEIREMRFFTEKVHSAGRLFGSIAMLIFHLVILFGLYRLKSFINLNASRKSA